ncbi:DUF4260 family protein [Ornithinibacillus sp. L9]|uniref:DUF4260 family protein n=1 Tax=Ornithinibacillus caprae TaxID=2678566 RepID=A0A6N8FNG2_9BACI|nr:DUF4260 domain-containing protein [Ornithinibacillus caprae]MUK88918.1 DUF4260 family protein [Ornithinibacillus caprae]
MNKLLLHAEGFAVLALSVYAYGLNQFSWLLFFILILAPDISMLGYLVNNKIGALLYNLFHTYTVAIIVIFFGLLLSNPSTIAVGIIWTAHIGMDRMFGFGLKYQSEFKETHLNRV